jgi:hypothetical protein
MVHALEEVHRVLRADGVIIDLRPVADHWPVEIVSAGQCWLAGRLEDLPPQLAEDAASEAALEQAKQAGLFEMKSQATFDFSYYWESLQDLRRYIEDEWAEYCLLPGAVFDKAQAVWEQVHTDRQARVRLTMQLGVWQRIMV